MIPKPRSDERVFSPKKRSAPLRCSSHTFPQAWPIFSSGPWKCPWYNLTSSPTRTKGAFCTQRLNEDLGRNRWCPWGLTEEG